MKLEFDSITKTIEINTSKFSVIIEKLSNLEEVTKIKTSNNKLELENRDLKQQVQTLNTQVNLIQQYTRLNNLELTNIPFAFLKMKI